MTFRTPSAATLILAATTVLAQSSSPVAVAVPAGAALVNQKAMAVKRGAPSVAGTKATGMPIPATLHDRVRDMDSTLAKMHVVLRQMRAKAAANSRDPLAKANLDMWELLVGHLDKQLQELRTAMVIRDDMETRRAAMYKQAEAKADAAAEAARRDARKALTPDAQDATQGTTGKIPEGAGAPSTPPANASPSPN